jgi:integrase
MSRRKGQNPRVRTKKRAGERVYYFQYWIDVPGQEDRERKTEVLGPVSQMTKSEAERRKLDFIAKLEINSPEYQIPSAKTFGYAAKHYREKYGPAKHRDSTRDIWEGRIKTHLEPDWKDVPVDLITFDSVNEWAVKKSWAGTSWGSIVDSLRTMRGVIQALTGKPPFSLKGIVPEREKLRMGIQARKKVSYSWQTAVAIAEYVRTMDGLGTHRREQYATFILLAAAGGLRFQEISALRIGDLDFVAGTILVDEATDQRTRGRVGLCKNVRAYRTVLLIDAEGREAMRCLKQFIGNTKDPNTLVFHSKHGNTLLETTLLDQCLHPALKALGLPKSGFHAFRRGCNRRLELAGLNQAVQRQVMGHSSATMTELYTGEIPQSDVVAAFGKLELETMETEAAA